MAAPIGCSGTTSCNLALTNSHRLAKEIQRKFLELKLDEDDSLSVILLSKLVDVRTLVGNME